MKMVIDDQFQTLKDFFKTDLGRQILYYSGFYALMWAFHLVLISLVSFFHLLLNHNIRTIGDWIGDRGWMLIIITKLLIFYVTMQFIKLKTQKLSSIKSYFRNSIQTPRLEIVVVILFQIIAIFGLGAIEFNSRMIFEMDRILLSIIGTFVFFSVDYIVLVVIDIFYPIRNEKDRLYRIFLFPMLFYFFTSSTFIYEQTISFRLYSFFFLLMYLGEWRRRNWTLPLAYLLLCLIPAYSILGLDPVWSDSYTFFAPTKKITTLSLFVLAFFSVGYLYYSLRKKPEYIYRD